MNAPELNKSLAETQFPKDGWEIYKHDPEYPELLYVKHEDGEHYRQINYLENWNDLMPLVVEHRIMLEPHDLPCADWCAFWEDGFGKSFTATNESPQRALIECLLKVLTEGKAK